MNHPVVMFKKSAVVAAGGYQHFPFLEDYYLWIRMLLSGAKFYNIQKSLLFFRSSSDMYKRRGGIKYAINEFHFQYLMKQMGFISTPRFTVRVMPNLLRTLIYKKILR